MNPVPRRHYTRDEADALLPQLRTWLGQLRELRDRIETLSRRVDSLAAGGNDVGGDSVNQLLRARTTFIEQLEAFASRGIAIKDLDRGLLDFPSVVEGREVFLCWEESEPRVEFWHDIQGSYAGRERL